MFAVCPNPGGELYRKYNVPTTTRILWKGVHGWFAVFGYMVVEGGVPRV